MPAVGDPVPPSACRYGPRMTTTESGITVGMPVWNAMPWLPEAIDSLFRQTTKAFAILVIADASTDGSTEYLRTLRDPRLRVVERPRAGLTAALNWLLDETRTPWLVRMDADDVSYPSRIAKLQAAIQAHPHAGLIYSLADYHPRERCAGQFRCSRGTSEELRSMVERGYLLSFCHSTVALRVDKVRAAGGYREGIRAEDADLWWRMARRFEICLRPRAAGRVSAARGEPECGRYRQAGARRALRAVSAALGAVGIDPAPDGGSRSFVAGVHRAFGGEGERCTAAPQHAFGAKAASARTGRAGKGNPGHRRDSFCGGCGMNSGTTSSLMASRRACFGKERKCCGPDGRYREC